MFVVQRIRVHFDDDLLAVRAPLYRERLPTYALAAQRARGRMLVHEETGAVDRPWPIELPELTQCRGLARGMIVKRLRIRSHGASLSIDHSHRIRYDVEDRLELSDAASEILTQIF